MLRLQRPRRPYPRTACVIVLVATATALVGADAFAQGIGPAAAPAASPRFEVASVKPNVSGAVTVSIQNIPGGRFTVTNYPLEILIRMAYSVPAARLVNATDWTARERFDITAIAEGPSPGTRVDFETVRLMLRTLLAERFGLVVHEETRDVQPYVLALDRDDRRLGPGLRQAEPCEAPAASEVVGSGNLRCGVFSGPMTKMAGRAVTMTTVAGFVEDVLDTPVVERTGLTGEFDLTFSFERDLNAQNSPFPSIFSALQEQLGLRLRSERVPMKVTVVDRIERPTPD